MSKSSFLYIMMHALKFIKTIIIGLRIGINFYYLLFHKQPYKKRKDINTTTAEAIL